MPQLPKTIKANKKEVSQTIDASKYLGANADNERVVQEFGQAIIDRIIDRTAAGDDIFGEKFDGYSKEYIKSEDFAEYGKSKNKINMALTGRMLDSIDFEQKGTTVKVAVDSENAPKAYNHTVGDTLPQRAFFGVTDKELDDISAEFQPEKEDRQEISSEDLALLDLFKKTKKKTARAVFSEMFQEFSDGN